MREYTEAASLAYRPAQENPAARIGVVEAPDAKSAIRAAIEKYGITDTEHQKRLAAYRVA